MYESSVYLGALSQQLASALGAAFVVPREWQTLRFEPADFAASFRGRAVVAPIVRLIDVQYAGLLISDKQSGVFRIELKEIRAE